MGNTLNDYKPILYANEGLPHLKNALGMAARVQRTFDDERRSFDKGDTINIRRPARFAVNDAPATAEDLDTEKVEMKLNYWRETKWKLSDREMAYADDRIVREHVIPAMYSLASDVDQKLLNLLVPETGFNDSYGIGTHVNQATADAGNIVKADILDCRSRLFDNGVPMNDGRIHMVLDGATESTMLGLDFMADADKAGPGVASGINAGVLGKKFGVEFFASQQAGGLTWTKGTASVGDRVAAVNNGTGYKAGKTSIALDGLTDSQTLVAGDEITFAGHSAHYSVTATVTSSSTAVTVVLAEGLVEAVVDNEVVTVGLSVSGKDDPLCMFHENAFAMVTAPLPDQGLSEMGVKVATVSDPDTGLSLRSRMYTVPNSSEIHFAFDILYGVKVLNSMYACNLYR